MKNDAPIANALKMIAGISGYAPIRRGYFSGLREIELVARM